VAIRAHTKNAINDGCNNTRMVQLFDHPNPDSALLTTLRRFKSLFDFRTGVLTNFSLNDPPPIQ